MGAEQSMSPEERVRRRRASLVKTQGVGVAGSPRMRRMAKILMRQTKMAKAIAGGAKGNKKNSKQGRR